MNAPATTQAPSVHDLTTPAPGTPGASGPPRRRRALRGQVTGVVAGVAAGSLAAALLGALPAQAAGTRYEAEGAALAGGATVSAEHAGYSGTGFVSGFTDTNAGSAAATFSVSTPEAGATDLALRYANGTGSSQSLSVAVDGGPAQRVTLPATRSWDAWSTVTTTARVAAAGRHRVVYRFAPSDSGNVNLDALDVSAAPTAPTPPTPSPPTAPPSSAPVLQAESAALSGGAAASTEHTGYRGAGFAAGFTDANRGRAQVSFAVDRPAAGATDLALRYANGSGAAQTLSLVVDGAARQVTLAPTPSWDSWAVVTTTVPLTKGAHTVAYRFGQGDSGNVNLDELAVATAPVAPPPPPTDPTPPPAPPTAPTTPPASGSSDEAEAAFLSAGAVTASSVAGSTGAGYAVVDRAGSRVVRTVTMPAAGPAAVAVRYRTSAAGGLSLVVNGRPAGTLATPPGDGWRTATVSPELRAGLNTIALVATASTGQVLLDSVAVAGDTALADRGATLPYVEYEAEDAPTTGTVIAPDRTYGTIAAESSGRRAVRLAPGQDVAITLEERANALVVRASIPDTADGRGQDAPLAVLAGGKKIKDITLSSTYSWVYGAYPYDNDPAGGGAHRFYDESRATIGDQAAGTVLTLRNTSTVTTTVDLVDAEQVAAPLGAPAGAKAVTDFGAVAGGGDATEAFRRAIDAARSAGVAVWVPQGTFRVSARIDPRGVAVLGAGPWWTTVKGTLGKGGFFTTGGGVTIADLTVDGDARYRDDGGSDAAMEGSFGEGSLLQDVWVEHSKVGLWADSGTRGLLATGLRVRNTYADGVNVHADVVGLRVEQSALRNTGDDALAMWSDGAAVTRSVFANNTVQVPVLANGIGIYGGNGNAAVANVVSDTVVAASGIAVGTRFNPVPLSGTTTIARNTLVRTGSREVNWNADLGALWIYADTADISAPVAVTDTTITDSTYSAVLVSYQRPVTNLTFDRVRIDGAGAYGFDLNTVGSATVTNTSVTGARQGGVLNRSGFDLRKGSGNTGF